MYPTQAASWVPNAHSPPQATRVLAQGHPRHSARKNAPIISSVPAYCGYSVEGGSVEVGKASTDAVVTSSVLILFSDVFLTQLLS